MATSSVAPDAGAVVRVPIPYADAQSRQHRPALVVATAGPQAEPLLLCVQMITSAEDRGWRGDVEIAELPAAGLPIPSVIRTAKIASVDVARAKLRRRIASDTLAAVRGELKRRLAL